MMKFSETMQLMRDFDDLMAKPLTDASAQEAVRMIDRMAGDDDEYAHSMEKRLWERALETLGGPLSRNVLSTREIEFSRWFA